jgi:hypothetical protein
MNNTKKRNSDIAEELESKLEDRDEARLETERARTKDLLGMQNPGAHDTVRRGINWGPSFRTRSKKAKTKQASEKNSDAKT